jgi:ABC-type transport system involved in cytochrome bd biosynthesis fused ATPase/permease subunit
MQEKCTKCEIKEDEYKYYNSFRDEIKREDEITHHRMITSMTFQGLLMAATGFMISGSWDNLPCGFEAFRLNSIFGIGVIGVVVAMTTTVGILATRLSIRDVKDAFERLTTPQNQGKAELQIDGKAPQIHGRGIAFGMGNFYTIFVPIAFVLMWSMYLSIFAVYLWAVSASMVFWLWAATLAIFGICIGWLYILGSPSAKKSDESPTDSEVTEGVGSSDSA